LLSGFLGSSLLVRNLSSSSSCSPIINNPLTATLFVGFLLGIIFCLLGISTLTVSVARPTASGYKVAKVLE
jgi:hypothetical protein